MLKTLIVILAAAVMVIAAGTDQGKWIGPSLVSEGGGEYVNSVPNTGGTTFPTLAYGWNSWWDNVYSVTVYMGEKMMRFYTTDFGWSPPVEIDSVRAYLVSGYANNPVRFHIYRDTGGYTTDSIWTSGWITPSGTNPPVQAAVVPPVVISSEPSFFVAIHNNVFNQLATTPTTQDSGKEPPIQGNASGVTGHSYSRYPPTWPTWTFASREYAIQAYVKQYVAPSNSDLATLSIDAPGTWGVSPDTIFTGTVYNPQATFRNNGPATATFTVQCIITGPGQPTYTSSKGVTNLVTGASTQVTFDPWTTPGTAGVTYTDSVKAVLATDPNQSNNILVKQYFVTGDVGFIDPIDPLDSVYVNNTYNPSARIKRFNGGPTGAFIDSCFILDGGGGMIYIATRTDSLAPLADSVHAVSFVDWTVPPEVGVTYEIRVFSRMPGDANPNNDAVIWYVTSALPPGFDVGVESIDEPTGPVKQGTTIKPKATVKNFGTNDATFDVKCTIGTYTSTKSVASLAKNTTQQVVFDDWTPSTPGDYSMEVVTLLTGDAQPSNDTMKQTVTVTGVTDNGKPLPLIYNLEAARPNPAAVFADINYALPVSAKVTLAVYDITGKLVKTLVIGSENAGFKSVRWDGRDNSGKPVPNGLYFIRLETPKYSATGKLVLTR